MFVAKVDYFETDDGIEILHQLEAMCQSEEYITKDSYTPRFEHLISFLDKHQEYIRKHPNTDARQYVANLRLMYRLR